MTDPAPPLDRPTQRRHDRALAAWLWRGHVRRWLPAILIGIALMSVDGAMAGAVSALLRPMFDQVLVGGQSGMIGWVALAIGGAFALRGLTALSYKTLMSYVSEKVITGLQLQMTRHLMRLDQGFFHTHPPGHLIDRVRGDTQELAAVFDRILPGIGRDVVSLIALIGVALYTDWLWTVVALLGVPLLVLPSAILQRLVRRMGVRARETSAATSTRLDEVFHGVVTIQRSGLEEHETERLARVLARYLKARVRTAAGQAGMVTMTDLVAAIGFTLVLVLAGGQIADGQRTVGEFMSFFAAIAFMFEPLRRLGALSGAWQNVLASLDRIHRLLQIAPRITQPEGPLAALPRPGQETVRLQDVTFAYDQEPVLRGLSLSAEAGQTTALVGASGAGKSTVFTLLTRLADPQQGRITIGGTTEEHDIRRMDLAGLRGLFSVVAQDSALFDETLRDNIVMGARDIDEARLQEALRAAHVDEFLPALPQGLETRVGPRGSALSGGQRQRVAIARALLRQAPILLLDEATSALDARSEALVQQALDRLSAGRTTLVIAHRLSTVRRADKIVVLDHGRVIEEGTHDGLIAAGGAYARLHDLQFQDRERQD